AGHRANLPGLTALVEPLPVRRLAGLDPGFTEHTVLEAALGLVGGRRLAQPRDVLPGEPADRRVQRRNMKSDGARVFRVRSRAPLPGLQHGRLVVLLDPA